MEALVYEAPEVMRIRNVALPVLGEDEVCVRVAYSGICGSELSGYLGKSSLRTPPLVFGHEVSGWVEEVGGRAALTCGLRAGDRVTANPLVTCGRCTHCLSGQHQLCPQRLLLGASLPGCNAEYVNIPGRSVLPIPESMGLEEAAMVEPAACAVHAVEMSGAGPRSTVLVVGAGPIGMFLLEVLGVYGVAERYVAEVQPARRERAMALGAIAAPRGCSDLPTWIREVTSGVGVSIAFDAVGMESTRRSCAASVASGGRIISVGLHVDETTLPVNRLLRSEVALLGSFAYSEIDFRTALVWLASGRLGLTDGVLSAPLRSGPEWYARLVGGDQATKVLLEPGAVAQAHEARGQS